ncbi:MAG TPA: hypothetical protein VN635_10585 [Conexibacter sp.]|nr:hypothetical protein [Conexibacter sp.]
MLLTMLLAFLLVAFVATHPDVIVFLMLVALLCACLYGLGRNNP